MTKKNSILIATFATLTTVLMACAATKPTVSAVEAQKILPKFDYAPKLLSKVGSSNITIALVNPIYGDQMLNMNPFEDMRKSMANDFEELLTTKGFKVRGPFNQVGEMLYNDKQNSDFIFLVDVDLNLKSIDRKYKGKVSTDWSGLITGGNLSHFNYTYYGAGTFSCNLTLTATSSKFGEKLWKKNITLPPVSFEYVGTKKWTTSTVSIYEEIMNDNAVYNEIAKVLEKQYNSIFELVEKQVEVEEMKTVAAESHKVDIKN